jgi:peptidoglycan hydrolase-like amidase
LGVTTHILANRPAIRAEYFMSLLLVSVETTRMRRRLPKEEARSEIALFSRVFETSETRSKTYHHGSEQIEKR